MRVNKFAYHGTAPDTVPSGSLVLGRDDFVPLIPELPPPPGDVWQTSKDSVAITQGTGGNVTGI